MVRKHSLQFLAEHNDQYSLDQQISMASSLSQVKLPQLRGAYKQVYVEMLRLKKGQPEPQQAQGVGKDSQTILEDFPY